MYSGWGRGKGEGGKGKGERGKVKGERGKGKGERGKGKICTSNRAAGYDLLWAGVAIALTSRITGLVHRIESVTANTINIIVFMVAIVVAVAHSFLTLNRL